MRHLTVQLKQYICLLLFKNKQKKTFLPNETLVFMSDKSDAE